MESPLGIIREPVDPGKGAGVMDNKVLGGIYWGLSAVCVLQLMRTFISRRRVWSLQSTFLALCLAWSAGRASYFSFVFQVSESCQGFSCVGGSDDGKECNAGRMHPGVSGECPGGECLSNSVMSCWGQHVLFGLPTMIQSFMLSTLIVFYAYWVHKATSQDVRSGQGDLGHRIYRRRVVLVCGLINLVYYVVFGVWVFGMRCNKGQSAWVECRVCRWAMGAVTAGMFYSLCGLLAYFSWKLYTNSQSNHMSSSPHRASNRRKVIWINAGIVVLYTTHGTLSLASMSPDRQDILPCPLLLFPDAFIAILGEVIPTMVLLLHFRRISRPSMKDATGRFASGQSGPLGAEPSRPAPVLHDSYDDDSDSATDSDADIMESTQKSSQAVFDDVNRYEERLTGIFQSSPHFTGQLDRVTAISNRARELLMGGGQGLGLPLLREDEHDDH